MPKIWILSTFVLLHLSSSFAEIIQQLDFESGQLESVYTEFQGTSALCEVESTISRAGNYAMKSHVDHGDRRAEIVGRPYTRGTYLGENWYGWSIFVPQGFPNDTSFDIVSQFHDYHKGKPEWVNDGKAPSSFLLLPSGNLQFSMRFQQAPETVGRKQFDLGPIRFGHWHDLVVNAKWTYREDGFIKIWRDGELKVDYTGSTYYDFPEEKGPYFKMGNYKGTSKWKGTGPRELFFDEYRMGNAASYYAQVDPKTYGGPADQPTGILQENAAGQNASVSPPLSTRAAAFSLTRGVSTENQVTIIRQGSRLRPSTYDLRGRLLLPDSDRR